ncbi:uncharacterized protein LOC110731329 [Chenopodium quinoa]|uniref:uncharacterized protein LOC110713016 n=1 Tax=Chenopodium quinoa TaxID=63459 RepID=UPI000B7801E3|nr:uncharacterized protein LOC110713016 [Chenopodium quinoa]XP_021766872.1 uncharacterized protein LOC110731329 [Chenopodium quinoa]
MAGRIGRKFVKDEDFEEGEVGNVLESRENSSPKLRKSLKNSSSATKKFTATARMIPKSSSSSSSSTSSCEKMSSAPLEIPDWSKIYGVTSKKKKNGGSASSWVDYNAVNHQGYYGNCNGNGHGHGYGYGYGYGYDDGHVNDDGDGYVYGNDGDDDDVDDDDDMVPPHEYLAKKLARSQISSFSVYEGIGRTLKGRDLSKVRNAILTKTGFLE